MAITLFKAISAVGLKTTAFLQSLFLFPFNAFMQALQRFPPFRQTTQPTLPYWTSGSTSGSSSSSFLRETHNDDAGTDSHRNETDMAVTSSSSAGPESQTQDRTGSKVAAPQPHTALVRKENLPSAVDSPTKGLSQLTDKLSRLELDGSGRAATASSSMSLRDVANGTGSAAKDGVAKQAVQDAALLKQHVLDGGVNGSSDKEVPRTPPVPLTHSVSQTSRPKGTATTTIELGGETVLIQSKIETPEQAAERAMHSRFMREALDMARLALKTNETPVGCVLVYKGRIIAKGMNATNVTRNGTRHAELMAICALLSYAPSSDVEPARHPDKGTATRMPLGDRTNQAQDAEETSTWGDVDPKDGHLYPYGQKLHPSPRVDPSVITECTLYVTVEPCVMCASLLRQLGIKKVYFGAVNDKFGGTGGVFRIHKNSPHSMASAPPSPVPQNGKGLARPILERLPASTDAITKEQNPIMQDDNNQNNVVVTPIDCSSLPGDGGNIERGFEAEGGWGRDEAVTLLRQFYVQENNRAPVPRKKEGRAARLAAMMERDGHGGGPLSDSGATTKSEENSGMDTPPVAQESAVERAAQSTAA
ncbi:cytidine deaminase-like protein [Parathielavia appendiculata]|uniref:Cytidine deaminase-like protein n=1 Tax=Parathielavia appendiculata TaxID=2587402 RepID=A0AAN6U2L9_9PEZI|nr:cytidine deaminase-like protein [Parathielavia appendiculata]